ncbi:hypothetical protein [Salmon gill poxvirus]
MARENDFTKIQISPEVIRDTTTVLFFTKIEYAPYLFLESCLHSELNKSSSECIFYTRRSHICNSICSYNHIGSNGGMLLGVAIHKFAEWKNIKTYMTKFPNANALCIMPYEEYALSDIDPMSFNVYVIIENMTQLKTPECTEGFNACWELDNNQNLIYSIGTLIQKLKTMTENKSPDYILGLYNGMGIKLLQSANARNPQINKFNSNSLLCFESLKHSVNSFTDHDSLTELLITKIFQGDYHLNTQLLISAMASVLSIIGTMKSKTPGNPTYVACLDFWKVGFNISDIIN